MERCGKPNSSFSRITIADGMDKRKGTTKKIFFMTSAAVLSTFLLVSQLQDREERVESIPSTFWDEPRLENSVVSCPLVPYKGLDPLLMKMKNLSKICDHKESFGGASYNGKGLDGDKLICTDAPWPRPDSGNCIIYSFGINNEWSFDDAMDKHGCQVFAFDPTMGKESYKRSTNIYFYNIGLGSHNGKDILNDIPVKMSRLADIVTWLGHDDRKIDYLKVDIDGGELDVFEDLWTRSPHLLMDKVAQIGMEIHFKRLGDDSPTRWQKYWKLLQMMECQQFSLIESQSNAVVKQFKTLLGNKYSCCFELLWVNNKFFNKEFSKKER